MKELICIVCPRGCRLKVDEDRDYSVCGNHCPKGAEYGRNELLHPERVVTSTVRCASAQLSRCPVKTSRPIPKEKIFAAMDMLRDIQLLPPVRRGQQVTAQIEGTEAFWQSTGETEK